MELDENLSFHRVPSVKRAELREKWLRNIKRQIVPETFFICSEHFEKSCFKRDLKSELLGLKPKNILNEDAVPSIFSHKNQPLKRRVSLERESRTVKKVIVENAISEYQQQVEMGKADISYDNYRFDNEKRHWNQQHTTSPLRSNPVERRTSNGM